MLAAHKSEETSHLPKEGFHSCYQGFLQLPFIVLLAQLEEIEEVLILDRQHGLPLDGVGRDLIKAGLAEESLIIGLVLNLMNKESYIKLWIDKARGDLRVAERELQFDDAVLDAVCFHLQQATEKLLKVYLIKMDQEVEKTHNLEFLLEKCIRLDKEFQKFEEKFDYISECGVEIRYPDSFIELAKPELVESVSVVKELESFVLNKLS